MVLQLSEGLILPADTQVNRLAFIGTSNSGKTYAATKLAEQMWDASMQFVALDNMGIWYGLRIGLDGGEGIPVTIFGGKHADIELTEGDGALVADIIFEHRISAIVDISDFETDAEKNRFAYRFSQQLYNRHKQSARACHVFLEEAHEYLPQNVQGGDAQMLHAWNRLWKQGGNFGLGGSIITQRPQDVNKKALELSALVLAFNTTGSNAVDAMRKWMGASETADLQSLQPGECIAWSPSWLRINKRIQIEPKRTFHARFNPLAAVVDNEPIKTLAPVDIATIKTRFVKPKPEAKQEEAKGSSSGLTYDDVAREVALAVKPLQERNEKLEWLVSELKEIFERVRLLLSDEEILGKFQKKERSLEIPKEFKIAKPKAEQPIPAEGLTASQTAIGHALASLASLGKPSCDRRLVAALAGQSSKSGSFSSNLAALRRADIIETAGEGLKLTENGTRLFGKGKPLTLAELHSQWHSKLSSTQSRMLRAIITLHPKPVTRSEIAELTSQSDKSGSFSSNLAKLRSFGLIHGSTSIGATALLFPEGLK